MSAKRKIKFREGSVGVKIVERQKKQGVGVRKDKKVQGGFGRGRKV